MLFLGLAVSRATAAFGSRVETRATTIDAARHRHDTFTHTTAAIGTALIATPTLVGTFSDIISPSAGFAVITVLAVVAAALACVTARRVGDQIRNS